MATIKPWALGAAVYVALSGICLADTLAARPGFSGTTIGFAAQKTYTNGTLTVVGPNGFSASVTYRGGLPSLNLAQFGSVADGRYTYQLNAATNQLDASVVAENNGRTKKNNVRPRRGDGLSGTFLVKGGSIVATPLLATARAGRVQDQD